MRLEAERPRTSRNGVPSMLGGAAAAFACAMLVAIVSTASAVGTGPRRQLVRVDAASGRVTARVPAGATFAQLLAHAGGLYGVDAADGVAVQLDARTGRERRLVGLGDAEHRGDAAFAAGSIWFADANRSA